jgi:uncharacterized membrane protein YeaQ/YmgE (transglycosylase-associated protein family)
MPIPTILILLSLFWLLLGLMIGALANAAKLRPASWERLGWLRMPGLGALFALIGGWLGVLLLGRYFATGMALWVGVLGVTVVPWVMVRVRARYGRKVSE